LTWFHAQSRFDQIFEYSLIIKGISGALELLGAFLLFFIRPEQIHGFIVVITQKELLKDPNDHIANLLLHATTNIRHGSVIFAIIYLLIHGIIKLVAVIGILTQQLWAYPFSLITLGLLTIYQLYSIYEKPSIGMVLLTLFDVFILWLIWREYKQVRLLL
jgi:uncharacterized membrane protein